MNEKPIDYFNYIPPWYNTFDPPISIISTLIVCMDDDYNKIHMNYTLSIWPLHKILTTVGIYIPKPRVYAWLWSTGKILKKIVWYIDHPKQIYVVIEVWITTNKPLNGTHNILWGYECS